MSYGPDALADLQEEVRLFLLIKVELAPCLRLRCSLQNLFLIATRDREASRIALRSEVVQRSPRHLGILALAMLSAPLPRPGVWLGFGALPARGVAA
eukprot:5292208-Alexandrium_andersonii.AAC.1